MAKIAKLKNITAGTLVKSGAGSLNRIIINSHTSGIISLVNGLTGTDTSVLTGSITFAAGERVIDFGSAAFPVGLYVNTAGTLNISVLYN